MKRLLKHSVLRLSKGVGFHWLVGNSSWRRRRLAILCYHAVSMDDEHLWDPRFCMSPQLLEERCRMLRDGGFNVLGLGEGIQRLYAGTLPPKSVAITFDDGTYDFYARAWPILKRYQMPATVYLTTFYCYHPRPVFGMFCFYLMWKGRESFRGKRLADLPFTPDLSTESGRMKTAGALIKQAEERQLSLSERDALAERTARELGVDYNAILAKRILQLMKPEEVRELAAEGLDVQLHTHRHRTPNDEGLFIRELVDNRLKIAEMIGAEKVPVHFCYPSGVYRSEFFPWLNEEGIQSATTCESGLAAPEGHRYLLPRIVDTNLLPALEWEAWLVGVRELGGKRS